MKTKFTIRLAFLLNLAFLAGNAQNIGINNPTPAASALLDLTSTNKGLLAPRMSAAQRLAIVTPATGLLVYETTTNQFFYFDGAVWRPLASGSIGWNIAGNAGTVDGINFLGTTDNVPFNIKVNNQKAGRIDNTNRNVFYGYEAGRSVTAGGVDNTASGDSAMFSNTVGGRNTAVGSGALRKNTTGNNNTAVGHIALYNNTTGSANTAFGELALNKNTTGSSSVAVGIEALQNNTTGSLNTALGNSALMLNTIGGQNTAVGLQALLSNTVGNSNVAMGMNALVASTAGNGNVAVGISAMGVNTSGESNVAIGENVLSANTTGDYNVAVGRRAGRNNVTGDRNTFLGDSANVATGALINATAIGSKAIVSASNSMVLGSIAGVNGATASVNVGIGTTAPSAKLSVIRTGGVDDILTLADANNSLIVGTDFDLPTFIRIRPTSGTGIAITNNGDNIGLFVKSDAFANVGVGTSNPLDKLHVEGSIRMIDGNQGLNKIMVSDANGTASWQAAGTFLNGWSVIGNSGTVDGTNFIGTTDNVPFNIKVNNQKAGRIDRINRNTFFGYESGRSNAAGGINNSAVGDSALFSNITGEENSAFGSRALRNNTGDANTAFGNIALYSNTSGIVNSAFGDGALVKNTTGEANTAVGYLSMGSNIDGQDNTSAGVWSLLNNTSGNGNTGIGKLALAFNASGINNTGLGFETNVGANNLINATAIGARSQVNTSNSMVLGSINGVNGAISDVNVGIGTAAPAFPLDIARNTTNSPHAVFRGTSLINNDHSIGFIEGSGSDFVGKIGHLGSLTNLWSMDMWTDEPAPLTFWNTNTERMRIDASGNMGINTINPTRKLDVNGDARIGVNGTTLTEVIKATATVNLAGIPAGASLMQNFAVTNAATASSVMISPAAALADGLLISYARVSAAGTVEVKFRNATAAAIDPPSMDFYITVIR